MTDVYQDDEIIQVEEQLETGYFYLNDRSFKGPYDGDKEALAALKENCKSTIPGECRAIYHGTVRFNQDTQTKEPVSDMVQVETVAL